MCQMNSSQKKNENRVLQRYLEEIQREELLDPEEEIELARRISQGDRTAFNRLSQVEPAICGQCGKKISESGVVSRRSDCRRERRTHQGGDSV